VQRGGPLSWLNYWGFQITSAESRFRVCSKVAIQSFEGDLPQRLSSPASLREGRLYSARHRTKVLVAADFSMSSNGPAL